MRDSKRDIDVQNSILVHSYSWDTETQGWQDYWRSRVGGIPGEMTYFFKSVLSSSWNVGCGQISPKCQGLHKNHKQILYKLCEFSKQANPQRQKVDQWLLRSWGRRNKTQQLMIFEFLFVVMKLFWTQWQWWYTL